MFSQVAAMCRVVPLPAPPVAIGSALLSKLGENLAKCNMLIYLCQLCFDGTVELYTFKAILVLVVLVSVQL